MNVITSSAQLWRTVISNILICWTQQSSPTTCHASSSWTILLNAHYISCSLWVNSYILLWHCLVSDIAVFVLKRDVRLQLTNFDITVHTVIDCRPTCQHRVDSVRWSFCVSALKTVDSILQYDQSVLPTISQHEALCAQSSSDVKNCYVEYVAATIIVISSDQQMLDWWFHASVDSVGSRLSMHISSC